MHEHARKQLKTATDGSLTTQYERDQVFITNPEATEFLSKWSALEKLTGRMEALEVESQKGKKRDSCLQALLESQSEGLSGSVSYHISKEMYSKCQANKTTPGSERAMPWPIGVTVSGTLICTSQGVVLSVTTSRVQVQILNSNSTHELKA